MRHAKNLLLQDGLRQAEALTRQFAKTFYFTSFFLPKKKRLASYCIYALCRLSDEAVDSNQEKKEERLNQVEKNIHAAYSHSETENCLLAAFRDTVRAYGIPLQYFNELIAGMRMDLAKARYQNFDELYPYCYRVAGVVGLIMLKIFGYQSLLAEKYAVDLGIALQLTNILRDIQEDFKRGRIYLPSKELAQYNLSEESIQKMIVSPDFKEMMRFQIQRARFFYAQASHGIGLITSTRCRLVAFLILELYAGILSEIEKNKFDVYHKRAYVAHFKKLLFLPRLIIRFALGRYQFIYRSYPKRS